MKLKTIKQCNCGRQYHSYYPGVEKNTPMCPLCCNIDAVRDAMVKNAITLPQAEDIIECMKKNAEFFNKVYEYGGKHFVPHSKLAKFKELAILILRTDRELGFFDYDYPEHNLIKKFPYSHAEFYNAMDNSEADVFQCVENGKLYIPCVHELFIYEGRRDNKENIMV